MRQWFATLLFSLLLGACSSTVPAQRPADVLMNEGDAFFAENRYEDAIASWEKVRERYVSPEMNTLAELKIADAHFQAEHYVEAAVAYEAFLKAHPEHPGTADILYHLGIAYDNEMLAPERDPTTTRNALSAFETLLKRFPDDPRRTEVEPLMAKERDALAGHELHIGAYYHRKQAYAAAIGRLEPALIKYPDFSRKDELYFILGSAYLHSNKREVAAQYFNRLYKEYPQSKFTVKAQKLLEAEY